MRDYIIRWDCNNWYKDENSVIHILNQRGNRIILNKNQGIVWDEINYQSSYKEIVENRKLQNIFKEEDITKILSLFKKNNIISVRETNELFDSIFG